MDQVPAAWLVRGGRVGEREDQALDQGLFIAGWPGLGDISGCADRDELRVAVRTSYPTSKKGAIDNWVGQLWRLLSEIQVGDHVVMPLKTTQRIAIGRVTGAYRFRSDCPPGFQHVRPVEWLRTDLPRDAVQRDLLSSLGSLLTICGLRRNGADRRIAHLAAFGSDPGADLVEALSGPLPVAAESFLDAAAQRALEQSERITMADLLETFGTRRKSPAVAATIELALEEKGLTAKPPIMEAGYSDEIELVPVVDDTAPAGDDSVEPMGPRLIKLHVGRLRSATAGVVSVFPHDHLVKAQTLMLSHNFSQLAVIEKSGEFCGAVSWESIGKAHLAERAVQVEDAMSNARVVEHNEDLLGLITEIYASGFLFVRGADRKLCGIVTAADLTLQFGDVARPFVLLEEIEQRLHRMTGAVFTVAELAAKSRMPRKIHAGDKPMLGDYQKLFEDEAMWGRLRWKLDHEAFLRLFNEVRGMRNSLMHFSSAALTDEELAPLHGLLRMLRVVDPRP